MDKIIISDLFELIGPNKIAGPIHTQGGGVVSDDFCSNKCK